MCRLTWRCVSKSSFLSFRFPTSVSSMSTREKTNKKKKGKFTNCVYFHFPHNGSTNTVYFSWLLFAVTSRLSDVVVVASYNWPGCKAEEVSRAVTSTLDWFGRSTWVWAGFCKKSQPEESFWKSAVSVCAMSVKGNFVLTQGKLQQYLYSFWEATVCVNGPFNCWKGNWKEKICSAFLEYSIYSDANFQG